MRKRLLIGILFLALINSRPVSASSAYHLSQESTPKGTCYILTYTENHSGKLTEEDLDKSLEYDGRTEKASKTKSRNDPSVCR